MWDIVIWSDQAAIDFVPSCWANEENSEYKYPTNLSETKVRELIYESKDITNNFIWCPAKVKKKHVRTLERAKELCNIGQFTSTIESSDASDDGPSINKRKKTRRLIEEYDMDSDQKRGHQLSDEDSDDVPVRKKNFFYPKCLGSSSLGNRLGTNSSKNLSPGNSSGFLTQRKLDSTPTVCLQSTSTSVSPAVRKTSSDNPSASFDCLDALRKILKNQAEFQFEISEIKKKLESIENRLIVAAPPQIGNEDPEILLDKLPMKTVEAVREMEEIILDNNTFDSLTNVLFLVGGDTVQRTIYGIMKKILTNELAQQYSGQGKKHKLPFCNLKIYQSVRKATRKRHSNATDDEIQKIVALFLAQSKGRASSVRQRVSTVDDQNDDI